MRLGSVDSSDIILQLVQQILCVRLAIINIPRKISADMARASTLKTLPQFSLDSKKFITVNPNTNLILYPQLKSL